MARFGKRTTLKKGEGMKIVLDKIKENGTISEKTIDSTTKLSWSPMRCPLKQQTLHGIRNNLLRLYINMKKEGVFRDKSQKEVYKILSNTLTYMQSHGGHRPKSTGDKK